MIYLKVLLLEENGVMGRSLMTLMAFGLGGFGLYTELRLKEPLLAKWKYIYTDRGLIRSSPR